MTATKVKMPGGIRAKLMSAIAMLLVASILMVSTTYAWFTLSTAPEVTGITTSVGANGNLEIALLTTQTYANTGGITSAVGDSTAATADATVSNITWGNLVDLSNTAYGLSEVKLMPAKVNLADSKVSTTQMLQIAEYGADGRVSQLKAAGVVSAVKEGAAFTYDSEAGQTYGVRAVGTASNLSPAQIAFNNAKSNFTASVNSATTPAASAVKNNAGTFITMAMAGEATSYTAEQIQALKAIADGISASLGKVTAAYSDAAAAKVISAATGEGAATLVELASTMIGNTDASKFTGDGAFVTNAGDYAAIFSDLAEAQGTVARAKTTFANYVAGSTDEQVGAATDESNQLFGKSKASGVTAAANSLIGAKDNWNITCEAVGEKEANTVAALEAQAGELIAGSKTATINLGGTLQTIANFTGQFELTKLQSVTVNAGTGDITAASTTLSATVSGLASPAADQTSNITDTYGYVLDFAFRTNAAGSKLQLQTEKANRVYSDATGDDLATQGGGSTASYAYSDTGLTATQAEAQLGAMRLVFFNPEDGTVYANAKLNNITTADGAATAKIALVGAETLTYTLGKDAFTKNTDDKYNVKESVKIGSAKLSASNGLEYATNYSADAIAAATYDALPAVSSVAASNAALTDPDDICALTQNVVQKVSVLVYMDGDYIDNSDVPNYSTSGSLTLNLQFSSSAVLVPMQNTALKQMTK